MSNAAISAREFNVCVRETFTKISLATAQTVGIVDFPRQLWSESRWSRDTASQKVD